MTQQNLQSPNKHVELTILQPGVSDSATCSGTILFGQLASESPVTYLLTDSTFNMPHVTLKSISTKNLKNKKQKNKEQNNNTSSMSYILLSCAINLPKYSQQCSKVMCNLIQVKVFAIYCISFINRH